MSDSVADHVVEVRIPATAEQVPVLRAVAADIAMRHDFDLDAIEDLRLAVDEACGLLLPAAASDSPLTCAFQAEPDEIRVTVSVAAADPAGPAADSFGWHVLTALTDTARADVVSRDGTPVARIELSRARHRTTTP